MKKIQKSIWLLIFTTLILSPTIFAASLPGFAVVEGTSSYKTAESSIQTVSNATFNFSSASQILMDLSTGKILYSSNEIERLHPASVTKVMTLLLIMEAIDAGKLNYTDIVTCSANASGIGGSQIWFKEGETLTIDEALKCICIVSANDVCVAMAEHIAGSEENFVAMMNAKAKDLCMENTHFVNCHGLDNDEHYSCAKDIATMSRELVYNHPKILEYSSIWMDSIRDGAFTLSNTNKLLKTYPGVTGLKTGSTSQAGFNLTATATKNDLTLIAVVMKAPSSVIRNEEVTKLLNYGFSNYYSKTLAYKGDKICDINVNKHINGQITLEYQSQISCIFEKGNSENITTEILLTENISAPLYKGTSIGKVKFTDESSNLIEEYDITIQEDILRSSFSDYFKKVFETYTMNFSFEL